MFWGMFLVVGSYKLLLLERDSFLLPLNIPSIYWVRKQKGKCCFSSLHLVRMQVTIKLNICIVYILSREKYNSKSVANNGRKEPAMWTPFWCLKSWKQCRLLEEFMCACTHTPFFITLSSSTAFILRKPFLTLTVS